VHETMPRKVRHAPSRVAPTWGRTR
jgi:hypothetical protein